MSQTSDPAVLIAQIKDKLGIGDDKVYAVMGEFAEPEDLVEAGRTHSRHGLHQDRRHDALSRSTASMRPSAFRIRKSAGSRSAARIAGILTAQTLIYYIGVIDYPLIIGGKPLFDFTYSIPPTFELAVLFTAITTFLCTWGLSGLPRLYHPSMNYRNAHRASDDRFLLVVEADDPKFDPQKTAQDMRSVGANDVEVVEG